MNRKTGIAAALAAGTICLAAPAMAHIGTSPAEVHKGATFEVGFGVGHGCDGSPTIAVRLQVPDGVTSVRPVAKAGWAIEVVRDGDEVTQVNWTGGSLDDALYDRFTIRGQIEEGVAEESVVYFPMVQECAVGVHRWISIPVEGQPEPDEPAPGITVLPAEAGGGHGH
ncbi:MAG: YcnI family protein [Bauldia sp.]|nr:YcnI family protein [Bauldia sp.]